MKAGDMWRSTSLFCCLTFTCCDSCDVNYDLPCKVRCLPGGGRLYMNSMTLSGHTTCWPFLEAASKPTADLFRAKQSQRVQLCVARRCRHLAKQGTSISRSSRERHGAAEQGFRPNENNLSDVRCLLVSQALAVPRIASVGISGRGGSRGGSAGRIASGSAGLGQCHCDRATLSHFLRSF